MMIAIVEDQTDCVAQLLDCLKRYEDEEHVSLQYQHFTNGMDFLENYKPIYDIVFMDIDMPFMDGLKATKKLREIDDNVCLVFVTYLAQYAIKGYEVSALDYIIKPIKYANFVMAMNKAMKQLSSWDVHITIQSVKSVTKRLNVREIKYIEVFNNNVIYHTTDCEYSVRETLTDAEKKLIDYGFSRCNRSCTVNLRYITDVVQNEITLDEVKLNISRHKKKQFLSDLAEFWSR